MERALERDQAIALGMPANRMVLARGLDRAFQRFGARIGEKDHVGKGLLDQTAGQPLAFRNAVKVGDVP